MGVGKLFKEESNLSVLTKYKMRFTNAIHKAKIIVDEKGTKAAAGTASLSNRIFVNTEQFVCNRPFIFLLYNKRMHTILFMGVYKKPT